MTRSNDSRNHDLTGVIRIDDLGDEMKAFVAEARARSYMGVEALRRGQRDSGRQTDDLVSDLGDRALWIEQVDVFASGWSLRTFAWGAKFA